MRIGEDHRHPRQLHRREQGVPAQARLGSLGRLGIGADELPCQAGLQIGTPCAQDIQFGTVGDGHRGQPVVSHLEARSPGKGKTVSKGCPWSNEATVMSPARSVL